MRRGEVDPVGSPAIRVRGLRKRYRHVTAVDGVDLAIDHGEVFALLGPNAAGKTTTVEILEGYRDRDAGEVEVLGVDPSRAPLSWRLDIGIVLQSSNDLAELTVAETIRHFAFYYPDPHDPAELLDRLGLTETAGRRVRTLSGGQRRRLDVAIGIVGRPRVLFLDEPTTGFDPRARRRFWTLLRGLRDGDGTTIVLTTHYLDEAEALADRVAVMVRGRVVAQGDPATLGDRLAATATVRWMDGARPRAARTDNPARLVTDLTARLGGVVPGLTVDRPSLEDVYLGMIGEARR